MGVSWHVIVAGCMLLIAAVCGVASSVVVVTMIGEINRQRPDDNPLRYLGYTLGKMRMILREYRQYYPAGKLHIYAILLGASAIVAMLVVGVLIGLPI